MNGLDHWYTRAMNLGEAVAKTLQSAMADGRLDAERDAALIAAAASAADRYDADHDAAWLRECRAWLALMPKATPAPSTDLTAMLQP